ncbi:MAG: glycosyltransferase family 4 protein [Verrucomicrobia bacterium]|nr:glycosyltransferase family 4 protein [Verrucomicrobiota bacterium]
MRIALLSGAFPPQFDGIGDYSWWFSQALAKLGHQLTVFTSFAEDRPKPVNVDVVCCFDPLQPQTMSALPEAIRKAGRFDWLDVQYNPFSFGHRGLAPKLLPALQEAAVPIVLNFHETYVPLWPWRYTVMRLWQYPQFAFLVRAGRCHFVSTERWIPQVRRWTKKPCFALPVGPNLPRCELTKTEARAKLGLPADALILGVFGFSHGSKLTEWVGAAAKRIHARYPQTRILSVGQIGDKLDAVRGQVPIDRCPSLPGAEVSVRLRAMDLFLAPLTDGISTRRGSIIAAFQHGLPVCSTVRPHSDRLLRDLSSPALLLTSADDESRFLEAAEEMAKRSLLNPNLGADMAKLHDQHFAWPVLAQRFIATLQEAENSPNKRPENE